MFIDSIFEGLQVLMFWRFWVVLLLGGLISFAPVIIAFVFAVLTNSEAEFIGWLSAVIQFLWSPVVLTGSIILLTPLMLGHRNEIIFEFLDIFTWWEVVKLTGIGIVVAIGVGLVPILGSMPTIPLFAQSSAILAVITNWVSGGKADLWPGFFPAIGFAMVGTIVATVTFYVLVAPILALSRSESLASVAAIPGALIPAVLPVTVYAGWLRVANGF